MLPASCNKWRLVSQDFLKLLVRAIAPEGGEQWDRIKLKSVLLEVVAMGLQVEPNSALPTKHKLGINQWAMRRHCETGFLLKEMVVEPTGEVSWEKCGHFRLIEEQSGEEHRTLILHAATKCRTGLPDDLSSMSTTWSLIDNNSYTKAALAGCDGLVKVPCVQIFMKMGVALTPPLHRDAVGPGSPAAAKAGRATSSTEEPGLSGGTQSHVQRPPPPAPATEVTSAVALPTTHSLIPLPPAGTGGAFE